MPAAAPDRPPTSARTREYRRLRILALVKSGLNYGAIAAMENLSRERIRQIVKRSLEEDPEAFDVDPRQLLVARLEPALQVAARGVAEGKLGAINPLVKVIDMLEKLRPPPPRRFRSAPRVTPLEETDLLGLLAAAEGLRLLPNDESSR